MNDLRLAFRQLLKNPGFTAIAVLTLALGIGANTAIFTVVNAVFLRSLPVQNPDELVQVVSVGESGRPDYAFSYPFYEHLRNGGRTLSGVFAAGGVGYKDRLLVTAEAAAATEFVRAQPVSGNFFSVLGVSPLLGRTLLPEDDRPGAAQPVAVISHDFWQRRFNSDPAIIGAPIKFHDLPFTIIGVTPPGFFGFQPGENPELWWPLQITPQIDRDPSAGRLKAGTSWLRLVGRLGEGIEPRQAQAELTVLFKQYQDEFAATRSSRWSDEVRRRYFAQGFELWSARAGWTRLHEQFRKPLLIVMGAVGLVLLITCANMTSLLLVRAASRQREFSVRSALGAGHFRLIRQLLIEGSLLTIIGAIVGLSLAQIGTRLLQIVMRLPADTISLNLAPDLRVLIFTIAIAGLASILFGLAPALRLRRLDLATALKDSTGSVAGSAERHRTLRALVVAQVGLSLVLLVGAGLFIRTLRNLKNVDAGFDRENFLLFNVDFAENPDAAGLAAFQAEFLTRLQSLPAVRSASFFNFGFLSGNFWTDKLLAEGYEAEPGEDLECSGTFVGPRFFETFGIPILSGRAFGPADERLPIQNAPLQTAVINQTLARRYFGDADPIGRRLHFDHNPAVKFEIVGLVPDARYRSLRFAPPPMIYLPFPRALPDATFAVRVASETQLTIANLAAVARELNRTARVREVRTMTDVINASVQQERLIAQLGGFFSLVALALACLGLYGVLSFAVTLRTREIAVRVALGAHTGNILRLVVGQGVKLTLAGALLGLAAALGMTRIVSTFLFGVSSSDPVTLFSVSALLLVVAILASSIPARRAAKIDPMEALRAQ